jgi:hypothetical protein
MFSVIGFTMALPKWRGRASPVETACGPYQRSLEIKPAEF